MLFGQKVNGVGIYLELCTKGFSHQQGFGRGLLTYVQGNNFFGTESLHSHMFSA